MARQLDKHLLEALVTAYTARARLFHHGVQKTNIDFLIAEIDAVEHSSLQWDLTNLAISKSAFKRVQQAGQAAFRMRSSLTPMSLPNAPTWSRITGISSLSLRKERRKSFSPLDDLGVGEPNRCHMVKQPKWQGPR